MGSAIAIAIFVLAAIGVLIGRFRGEPRATEETATEEHGMAWFVLFLTFFIAALFLLPWLQGWLTPLIADWPGWARVIASVGMVLGLIFVAWLAAGKLLFRK